MNNAVASLNIWQSYGIKFALQIERLPIIDLGLPNYPVPITVPVAILTLSSAEKVLTDLTDQCMVTIIANATIACQTKIHALNLRGLTITNFAELHCTGRIIIEQLDLTAKLLSNQEYLEIKQAKLHLTAIKNNHGKIYIGGPLAVKLVRLDNNNGELHSVDLLNLAVTDFYNANGKISGLAGTFIEIKQQFNSNEHSVIGFSAPNAGIITELKFRQNNYLTVDDLGTVVGRIVKFKHTIIVARQGKIIGLEAIELISPNRIIRMQRVAFITPELKIYAPNFALSKQTNCQRTIVVLPLPQLAGALVLPMFCLTNEYHTTGKFVLAEHGINKHNINKQMLDCFGQVAHYAANNLGLMVVLWRLKIA